MCFVLREQVSIDNKVLVFAHTLRPSAGRLKRHCAARGARARPKLPRDPVHSPTPPRYLVAALRSCIATWPQRLAAPRSKENANEIQGASHLQHRISKRGMVGVKLPSRRAAVRPWPLPAAYFPPDPTPGSSQALALGRQPASESRGRRGGAQESSTTDSARFCGIAAAADSRDGGASTRRVNCFVLEETGSFSFIP